MRSILNLVTPPTIEPVTLSDMYLWLGLVPPVAPAAHPHDALISSAISSARMEAETICRRSFINTVYQLWLADFPCSNYLELPTSPVGSVASVKYYDESNVLQTLSTSVYGTTLPAGPTAAPGEIFLKLGQSWPTVYVTPWPVQINYTSGYGTTTGVVPDGIKNWIKAKAATLYAMRETEMVGSGKSFDIRLYDRQLSPYIVPRV